MQTKLSLVHASTILSRTNFRLGEYKSASFLVRAVFSLVFKKMGLRFIVALLVRRKCFFVGWIQERVSEKVSMMKNLVNYFIWNDFGRKWRLKFTTSPPWRVTVFSWFKWWFEASEAFSNVGCLQTKKNRGIFGIQNALPKNVKFWVVWIVGAKRFYSNRFESIRINVSKETDVSS